MDSKKTIPGPGDQASTMAKPQAAAGAEMALDHGLLAWLAQFETLDRMHAFHNRGRWFLRDGQVHRC